MVHTLGLIEKQRLLKKQLSPNTMGKLKHQNRKKNPNLCKVPSCVKKEIFLNLCKECQVSLLHVVCFFPLH
jgi:hypothetical protein